MYISSRWCNLLSVSMLKSLIQQFDNKLGQLVSNMPTLCLKMLETNNYFVFLTEAFFQPRQSFGEELQIENVMLLIKSNTNNFIHNLQGLTVSHFKSYHS